MLKFIRGKGHQPSAERLKLQKDLFAFNKTTQHGFPHRPSALAWDPELKIMAIGTRTGTIKIYGRPGVEFYGHHDNDCSVTQLFSLPNQGRFISLCDDNSLHLWEVNEKDGVSVLEEIKSCSLEGRLKKISTCFLTSNAECLLIGTEGGNIYLLDVKSFKMTDTIIYQDVVMQNVPDDYRVNPGAVEAIAEHPIHPNKILIGYNRGLLVLWDNESLNADHTYVGTQQLESVCWHRNGESFMSSHNDGSYIIWNLDDPSQPKEGPKTPYGPFPCKAINKLLWRSAKGDDFIIFGGGMPRASYGDRHTVTVFQGDTKQVVFDFTSRVVDFFTICDTDEESELDDPHSLVVLAEEEMVVLDLHDENWAPYRAPYLASLHSSAITCAQHFRNIPDALWSKVAAAGELQGKEPCSTRKWPITGGVVKDEERSSRDLLLTGHEDGAVRFWDASGISMRPLYKLTTSGLFAGEDLNEQSPADDSVEEWPPFRKVGCFDPFSDDPRLAIRKIALCTASETLVVAGTAGQVLIMSLSGVETDAEVESTVTNIVSDRDGFVWKGHERLVLKKGVIKYAPGFRTDVVLQFHPPAAVTALALHTDWGLVAAGTAHGFSFFDYLQNKTVASKCTLNPNDLTGAGGDAAMARRKSFKKSLRESFRRLRRGRSRRADKSPSREGVGTSKSSDGGSAPTSPVAEGAKSGEGSPAAGDTKPVERQIEARSSDDALASMVRCLCFAKTFIVSVAHSSATLWAGTNSGSVYVFIIALPAAEKRNETAVVARLGKEIQLKHRAPVVAISVVDYTNRPLPDGAEAHNNRNNNQKESGGGGHGHGHGSHRVVICSEEQFKVFTLPSLKPYRKFKLTAHEGARVRKIGFLEYHSRNDSNYSEFCITCLTNQGDLGVYSIPDMHRQLGTHCIKREDINGISSLVYTCKGEGFYLHSSSEFQRFSLSASSVSRPKCSLELPDGSRSNYIENNEMDVPRIDITVANDTIPSIDEIGNEKDDEENGGLEANASSGDITVDSVKDHMSSSMEEHIRITEHTEQKVEVKREETIMTIETTIIASEVSIAEVGDGSVGGGGRVGGYQGVTAVDATSRATSSTETVTSTRSREEIKDDNRAPLATIEELF